MIDLILHNGKIATLETANAVGTWKPEGKTFVQAVAIEDGKIKATGSDAEILPLKTEKTRVIDLKGRTAVPGLNDSHLHVIRGGLNYNMELRWDGVPSLADGLRMLKEQVARTPAPQWVRVVGGFNELQFAEKRLPTIDELNVIAPDTPVFILHLYDRAILNRAALRAVGYTKDTPDLPGSYMERDAEGNPTGILVANPNATILYKTLSLGPLLTSDQQINSTRHFMRELNRLGLTSACDAGGGFQNWPDDYSAILELEKRGEMTMRIAYNLFTQRPKKEREDFANWTANNRMYQGDEFLRLNGAGEMLVYSAADFEDFRVPRPDMPDNMEQELEDVVRLLARNKWAFRLHATYDETITRALDIFERVNRETPLTELRWFFDHCETIGERNIDRIKALGGGIAIQHRMAYQGEYFVQRYGEKAAYHTPPFKRMIETGLPVGAGTDATRVASYNPWVSLAWLSTGRTVGGATIYPEANLLSRMEALRLYTLGSAWFSREEDRKGKLAPGYFADIAVLSDDFFECAPEKIRGIESVLTILGGKVVYADGPFKEIAPPPIPVMPDWSPVTQFGGYWRDHGHAHAPDCSCGCHAHTSPQGSLCFGGDGLTGGGCSCAVF